MVRIGDGAGLVLRMAPKGSHEIVCHVVFPEELIHQVHLVPPQHVVYNGGLNIARVNIKLENDIVVASGASSMTDGTKGHALRDTVTFA